MPNTLANARRDQAMVALSGHHFWNATQLFAAEIPSRLRVEPDSCREQNCGWDPCPEALIERQMSPRCGYERDGDPHAGPGGKEYAVRRAMAAAPIFCARMNQEPEAGDGGV